MRLLRIPEPFDHPDFIFEPKLDGFRALAIVRGHHCALVSRNGHTFKQWPQLAEELAHVVRAHAAVLDGEIWCLDDSAGGGQLRGGGVLQANWTTAGTYGLAPRMSPWLSRVASCNPSEVSC